MKRFVLILFSVLLIGNALWAGTNYDYVNIVDPNNGVSISYNEGGGYFTISFKYYFNPTKSSKDVSFEGGSYIDAKWNGTTHRIMNLQGKSNNNWCDYTAAQSDVHGWVWVGTKFSSAGRFQQSVLDGNAATAEFRYYPPQGALGFTPEFFFNFVIEEDDDGNGSMTRTATKTHITLPSFSSSNLSISSSYSSTPNKMDLKVTYTGGSVPRNLTWLNVAAFGNANSITHQVNRMDSETTYTAQIQLVYNVNVKPTITLSTKVKGYQAIKNFKATYREKGDVLLSWDLNHGTGNREEGYFVIERALSPDFTNEERLTSTLACESSKETDYTFIDDLVSADITAPTIYYRITRTPTFSNWDFAFGASTQISPEYKHVQITSATSRLIEKDGYDAIEISWTYNNIDYIWSTDSKFKIVRNNTYMGTSQEIPGLTKNDIESGKYVDQAIQKCNTYKYEVYVLPGNLNYKSNKHMTDPITPSRMGSLKTADASKGYYSDRIELEWQSNGTFNQFSVARRLHGDTDEANWRTIQTLDGVSVISDYMISDATALPGYIYDYRVVGMLDCSDSTIYSNYVYATGFRTPTGDFYGQVTFPDGQVEDSVEVRLSCTEAIQGQSVHFPQAAYAQVNDNVLLSKAAGSVSLQAWVMPDAITTTDQHILTKSGMYDLGINQAHPYFQVGNTRLTLDTMELATNKYAQLTAVYDAEAHTAAIYYNGILRAFRTAVNAPVVQDNAFTIGADYAGYVDEIRVWSIALPANSVMSDYGRHLIGNETGLAAYYNFDYCFDDTFFDISYTIADYNKHHGSFHNGVELSAVCPSENQLAYRGLTNAGGTYSICAVPYYGNGTAYTLTPLKGTHTFSPVSEVRLISSTAQSHTVNFKDNSSFDVSGTVRFAGGTMPVEGAWFEVDGVVAKNANGSYKLTDEKGEFKIQVPVGVHEVKVVKDGHMFANGGKITYSNGEDRNYQDILTGVELWDETRVKFVGRIAGGVIQESYPVGLGLSTNNLGEGIKLVLTHTRPGTYKLASTEKTETITHDISGNLNQQTTDEDGITITVNDTTGEFFAFVQPIAYGMRIDGTNYTFGTLQQFNFDNVVLVDTFDTNGTDTAYFNKSMKFIKRFEPIIDVWQLDENGKRVAYFGEKQSKVDMWNNMAYTADLYDESSDTYLFGKPVFTRRPYKFGYKICETYTYMDKNGNPVWTDSVPTQDARVEFTNELKMTSQIEMLEADSVGCGLYSFDSEKVDPTSAESHIWAKVYYGKSSTSFDWVAPFENGAVYTLGYWSTGVDFITAGPNKVLTILRDPPGSGSYAYLEKGVSFSESSTYTGSIENDGWQGVAIASGAEVKSFIGFGAGTISEESATTTTSIGVVHNEQYEGSDSKSSTTTVTTRYQTSDDPLYVGANGDVYIGYSTNITFGSTQNISIIPRSVFNNKGGETSFEKVYDDSPADWVLVQTKGRNIDQTFKTTFAYPQVFIEQSLIPNLETIRNSFLIPYTGQGQIDSLQALANQFDTIFYVSYQDPESEFYGLANTDSRLADQKSTWGVDADVMNGPSYNVIFSNSTSRAVLDTVLIYNQWINQWKFEMGKNEYQKLKAQELANECRMENFSFHAGSPVEYSESYSAGKTHESTFSIMLGANTALESDIEVSAGMKNAVSYKMDETYTTTHGGTFSTEAERSHCKGFVLAEDGDDDYLSVTVYREPHWSAGDESYDYDGPLSQGNTVDSTKISDKDYFSSFIFVTEGGATSCPYEDAYYAKYLQVYNDTMQVLDSKYKPVQTDSVLLSKPTMRLEVPYISMENNFMENVPSGEPAYFTVYMRNNSETGEDQWFKIFAVDESNPDGAMISFDGNTVTGFELNFLVKAGETLVKTMTVEKGRALNYDNLQIVLGSQCQSDPTSFLDVIADTITFSVHFLPTCTDLDVVSPSNNWTYNTKCRTALQNGLWKHFIPIKISNFDANYTDFDHIELQYKPAAGSDEDWSSLCYWYTDSVLYEKAVNAGNEARMILASDAGTLTYNFFMDDQPDQKYDLRAVSVCNINNTLYENPSPVVTGIKDMYNPRLFGAAKPANGILTIEDEIRLDFNEPIAEGLLTSNNFTVTGIRNGAATNHDVAIQLDGVATYLTTELQKNYSGKDLTIEGWINTDRAQNATIFSHGDAANSLALAMTDSKHIKVRFGQAETTSMEPAAIELGSWNHVALTYNVETEVLTAYVNWVAVIEEIVDPYTGIGLLQIGRDLASESSYFNGKVDQFRVWNACRSSSQLQANAAIQLSGNDVGLIGCYDMDEARGKITADKARGVNLILEGAEWALPDGFSTQFDGNSGYLAINTSATVVTADMDYTLEFWFKTDQEQQNSVMLCNGDGLIATEGEVPAKLFSVGWNENKVLCYRNNGYETEVPGNWCDGEWHQFAFTVSRSSGHARIYMDGKMITYIAADMVGAISSDFIFAGARVWYSNTAFERVVDNFFSGKIDEIRLWKLYRTQSQMEELSNQKLTGDEIGLLLYYPFEHYITYQGVAELQYTLNDYVSDTIVATTTGLTIQSSDIAPVRTQGAVSKLLYDFVVNNDALIITLKEDDYRIENTIVNFAVEDVRDLHGNSILSPITWSAYIDRNQLQWQEEEINITKQQYDNCQFTVGITNKGGYVQNYTIRNLPTWLSANPANGTLNPTKSKNITFTIDPGLNVGTYNEVIYLVDAQNVSEPLPLNITVKGETPDWSVTPADYQYSMSVFGLIRVDGVYSMDPNDRLAAFSGGECVGVAGVEYNEVTDMYYLLLTIYSNKQSSNAPLSFRMYDASTGIIYSAVPSEDIKFTNNKIYGTPMTPVLFDCGELLVNNMPLQKGWNWISFNLKNDEMSTISMGLINAEWSPGEQIKNQESSATYSEKIPGWNVGGCLESLDNKQMYMVMVFNDKILPMSGSLIDPTTLPLDIQPNRWNYISYLPQSALPVKTAMAGYDAKDGDVVKSQNAFAMYFGNEWIGSLTYMKPNDGYMLFNTSDSAKTLTYPSKASTVSQLPARKVYNYHPYTMSVFAHCEMAQPGDVIYAMVDGEIRGEAVTVNYEGGTLLQCLSISGLERGERVNFLLVRDDETYMSSTEITYTSNSLVGSPVQPLEIEFNGSSNASAIAVYPVPAVTHINVAAMLQPGEPVCIEIYDLLGKKLMQTPVETADGMYLRSISVEQLAEGSYFLRLVSGSQTHATKFIKY